MADFKTPSRADFDRITEQTAEREKSQLLAVSARYDRRSQRVMISLNSGAVVGFPLSVLPGLEEATPDELRKIVIQGGGYGLYVSSRDADISIPHLLADQLGSPLMVRAVARASASRANGALGGRPRKPKAA